MNSVKKELTNLKKLPRKPFVGDSRLKTCGFGNAKNYLLAKVNYHQESVNFYLEVDWVNF